MYLFIYIFRGIVSLSSPECPGTHCIELSGPELGELPASAFQVLGLKAYATTGRL